MRLQPNQAYVLVQGVPLVPFGDRHALSAAIIDALQRDWDRSGIAARAREFSWEATAQQVIEVMQGALAAAVAS